MTNKSMAATFGDKFITSTGLEHPSVRCLSKRHTIEVMATGRGDIKTKSVLVGNEPGAFWCQLMDEVAAHTQELGGSW